ncbi:MAG TPA: TIGR04290 family methyltransferase [Deinococcales bacterium]|nr:TIGR04290 family methyltransferase [Deinococcales bacterium]
MPGLAPGSLREAVDGLAPWFHNLHLPDGTQTAPDQPYGDFPSNKWRVIAPHIPEDLTGLTALDIGCNAGFYSFELARRGAQVTAIDLDEHYLSQARWAAEQYGLADRLSFRSMQVYDLAHEPEQYDIVWFMGVLYHLRYPLLGLDIVAQKTRKLLVFQTMTMPGEAVLSDTHGLEMDDRDRMLDPGWPKLAFIEHHLAGDPTNWWAPNHAAVEAMLRSAGMRVLAEPGHEVYICEPDPERPSSVATWNQAELLSATGRPWRAAAGPAHTEAK